MGKIIYPASRWLILATMFVATATASIFLIAPAPLIGEMMRTIPGVSPGQITFITMSIFNIFVIVSTILGGPLLDKFGAMRVYIAGLILLGIGALLTPFIGSSSEGLIFIRILQGLGTGPILVSAIPIAARYFPVKLRSTLIILQGLAVSSGIWIGMLLISRIFQATQNWQTALAWLAPISIVGLIFSFIAASCEKRPEEELSGIKTPFKEYIKLALLMPITWVVIACIAMFSWIYQAFNDLIPSYFNAAYPVGLGYDPATSGSLLLVSAILVICGGIVGVLITEKFLKGNEGPVVLAGFALAAVFIYLIGSPAIASNHMILGISVCSAAFFLAFISPLASGYIAKYYPKHITGTLGGLALGIGGLVSLAGVTAGGIAMQTSGGYQMSFRMMVGVAVIGAIIAIFLKPVKELE